MSKKIMKMTLVLGALALVLLALTVLRPVDGNVVAADPTATPAPTATPVPFTATVKGVAMYPAMGAINKDTGRPTGILVARGDDPKKTYAVFGAGMANVPPGVPVYVEGGAFGVAQGAKVKGYAWTLNAPGGSKAALVAVDGKSAVGGLTTAMASFTPDKEGDYVVSLTVKDDKSAESKAGEMKFTATKYVGNAACAGCHPAQAKGWATTNHGTAFQRYVSMNVEAEYFSAGFGCARCHTVGYYPVAESTGGWWDVFTNTLKLNWMKGEFTVTKDAEGKALETPVKYNSISEAIALNGNPDGENGPVYQSFDPKLQAVSNIGCESCHGPGGAHVAASDKAATAPLPRADSSACQQCHNASGHHTRGGAVMASKHEENASLEEGDRTPCNACHSPEGAVDTMNGVAADKVRAENGNIGCATCHDPHSSANTFQLRMVDNVKIPTADIKDAGLSAVCMQCHNNRTNAMDPKTGVASASPSYPHYSSAAEMLAGVGGYDWGAKIENGFHSNLGKAPITDEAGTVTHGGAAPGSCVLCHMNVTPGGIYDTVDSMKVPGHQTVGGHTFNMTDGKTEAVAVCQQCHPGVKDFNFTADGDFDGNGKPDGVQTEVKSLLDKTWTAIVAKAKTEKIDIKKQDGYPYYVMTSTDPAVKKAAPSTDLKAAIYNFRYVNGIMWAGDGKSAAIHNFERSVGLLQLTIEKLSGKPLDKAELLYTMKK